MPSAVRPVPPIQDHPKADEILPDTPPERPFPSRFRWVVPSSILVVIQSRQTTLTRILSRANSSVTIFAKATCAALMHEYAVAQVLLKMRVPFTEAVITIAPPCSRSSGTLARVIRNVLVKLVVDV